MTDTTNAGPVLPRLPDHDGWSDRPYWQASSMFAYGRQCAEQLAGPLVAANAALSEANASLRERVAELERDLQFVERWANHHGVKPRVTPAEALGVIQHYPAITDITDSYADGKRPETPNPYAELARLRAENVIEWEPGRSYTAAELLRRAIRGIRVRKGRPLWPAVMNLCGVGSTVGHHLCRWAGRDPDTGADLDAARVAIEGNQ